MSNHFTSHPNKFKMPENNLKLYVDSENNQSGYKYSNYFLLKELGSSSVMLKSYFNPHSVIEKLGKNKVRIYISEKLEAGKLNFSSPAYLLLIEHSHLTLNIVECKLHIIPITIKEM